MYNFRHKHLGFVQNSKSLPHHGIWFTDYEIWHMFCRVLQTRHPFFVNHLVLVWDYSGSNISVGPVEPTYILRLQTTKLRHRFEVLGNEN